MSIEPRVNRDLTVPEKVAEVIASAHSALDRDYERHKRQMDTIEWIMAHAYQCLATVGLEDAVEYRITTAVYPEATINFWVDSEDFEESYRRLYTMRRALRIGGFRFSTKYVPDWAMQISIRMRSPIRHEALWLHINFPDATCSRVQVGTREQPVYEIRCG